MGTPSHRKNYILPCIAFIAIISTFTSAYFYLQNTKNIQTQSTQNQHHIYRIVLEDSDKSFVIKRNYYNQYLTEGEINGERGVFVVDTGATEVVVPEHIAKQLNLEPGPASYAETASGRIVVYMTLIEEIKLGDVVLEDVPAIINPQMDNIQILLGMSALKHIDIYQSGENMTLIQKHKE